MIGHLPMLSSVFHLSPSDVWALTTAELDAYLDAYRGMAADG